MHKLQDAFQKTSKAIAERDAWGDVVKAMMRANHDSDITDTSVPPEEISELEISELVKPINFETE